MDKKKSFNQKPTKKVLYLFLVKLIKSDHIFDNASKLEVIPLEQVA